MSNIRTRSKPVSCRSTLSATPRCPSVLTYTQMVGDGFIAFENAHKNMASIQAVSQQIPGVIRDLDNVL